MFQIAVLDEFEMKGMSEAELQSAVMQLCGLNGWMVTHFRPSQSNGRWMTALQGHAGWPDLALMHEKDGRFAVRELKREDGKLTDLQKRWLAGLHRAGVDADVWRPSDLLEGRIEQFLRRKSSRGVKSV